MNLDKMVFAFAGSMILISLLLSQLHHIYWLWFTAFIGLNLLQSAFTGFCPLAMMLKKLGVEGAIVGKALYTGDINLKQALAAISQV